jgi:predicted integral membrane protein DUF2269
MGWFGAGLLFNILFVSARSTRDARLMASLSRANLTLGRIYFSSLAVLTLGSGILMVLYSTDITFTDAWILIGLAGVALSGALVMWMLAPSNKRLIALIDERGTIDGEVKNASKRGINVARVELVVLAIVVWAMVAKPGA